MPQRRGRGPERIGVDACGNAYGERMTHYPSRRAVLSAMVGAATAPALSRVGRAAEWRPNALVRIVVPAAPGGTTDVMGRLLAQHLQSAWGQSAVVENKSGGGGTIGTADFVRQKPDGHTILLGNPGPNAIAFSVYRNMPYRADQILPVSNLIRIPNMVSAHPSVPVHSIAELIAHLKANPDSLSYASSGTGQSPHLSGAWFLQLTGLKMAHIPFRGAGPALTAVLGGQVPILFDNLYPSLPQAREGKLRGLAVTTPERSLHAPDLPTMRESAPELASYDVSSWFGVFLQRDTPPVIVAALSGEIKTFLQRPDMQARINDLGARPDYGTPEAFAAFVTSETEKFAGIIRRENLQMEIN
jgi:tripartite-type tricarboxylate transporter receptor subunit TctC